MTIKLTSIEAQIIADELLNARMAAHKGGRVAYASDLEILRRKILKASHAK